jgi:type II secretory pathway component PulF
MLAARACALTETRNRQALADELELTRSAHLRRSAWRLAPTRASVEANAAALSELVALLRSGVPLYARGLAMLAELLTDGTGPLYARGGESALAIALTDARAALTG